MIDLVERLGVTLWVRPYVAAFFVTYAVLALRQLGPWRFLAFTAITWAVALVCELASTRTGFPFGLYHYVESGLGERELRIADVPVWDSLSFVFLSYASLVLAAAARMSRGTGDLGERLGRAIVSPATPLLGALLMTILDVVIDPVTVRGDRWFLGRIYVYPEGGVYFGVPLSNFAGWYFVGFVSQGLFVVAVRRAAARHGWRRVSRGWLAAVFGLYAGVLAFMLAVTVAIAEAWLALAHVVWIAGTLVPLVVVVRRRLEPRPA